MFVIGHRRQQLTTWNNEVLGARRGVERNESRASFRDVLVTRGIRVQLYKPNKHQQSHANCISANRTVTYKCAPWLKEGIDWTRKEKVSGSRRWGCGSMGYELSGDSSSSTHTHRYRRGAGKKEEKPASWQRAQSNQG